MEQFIWNVNYNTNRIQESLDSLESITSKLPSGGAYQDLTIEEMYLLREVLQNIRIHADMTQRDVLYEGSHPKKPLYKRLFKK
jgi:hypothetical protein